MSVPWIALRPATAADEPLLRAVLGEARRAELVAAGVGEREAQMLLDLQYRAQDAQYRGTFPDAEHSIVEIDGVPAGRLLVDRRASEFRVVDIALQVAFQGRGVGSSLLRSLQNEAAQAGRPVRLRVARGSPAQRLYARLGFRQAASDEIYVEMVWEAEAGGLAPGVTREYRGAAA